jgi:hypothetical protein
MKQPSDEIVAASAIGSWAWCPEFWRLEASGATPDNRTQLDAETKFHKRTGWIEIVSRLVFWLGVSCTKTEKMVR